jgi:hypothetical protein
MIKASNPHSGQHRRNGNHYLITPQEVQQFNEEGYIILDEVLTEMEMEFLDLWFDHFVQGNERQNMGRDFCDMSQSYDTPIEDFQLVNAMLPSHYRSELENNVFQKVSKSIADQLYRKGKAEMDYEQFLAKKPTKGGAEFAMHQDLGYWPKTENTWTATFSLALTDSDLINGCLHVIPGSNNEKELRKHTAKGGSRDDSHTLVIEEKEGDEVIYLPVKRGSITVHDERIVHGSAGNLSDIWRKTYIIAYRDSETIKQERAIGFTHSHNDKVNWEEII